MTLGVCFGSVKRSDEIQYVKSDPVIHEIKYIDIIRAAA